MLTASAMQHYEADLAKAVILTLFIPLIISSGGNSGSQATSLLIRALALHEVRLADWWRVILRELPTGITLGVMLGLIGMGRIALWQLTGLYDYGEHWMLVAMTIGAALVGVVTDTERTRALRRQPHAARSDTALRGPPPSSAFPIVSRFAMFKRSLIAVALVAALGSCSTTNPDNNVANPAAERMAIDRSTDAALTKLYAQVPGSREMVASSRGVLVFPNVVSAGLVVGGSYGKGELLVNGRRDGYYRTTGISAGLLAGADSKAVYVLFMNSESLEKFRASKGWTAGADASVSVLKAGAAAVVDTQTASQSVVGYVLTNAGLMANISIDGTKVTPLPL